MKYIKLFDTYNYDYEFDIKNKNNFSPITFSRKRYDGSESIIKLSNLNICQYFQYLKDKNNLDLSELNLDYFEKDISMLMRDFMLGLI